MKTTKYEKKKEKKSKPKMTADERKKSIIHWIIDIGCIFFGSTMYSAGLHCFSAPNSIAAGGVAGG